MAKTRENKSLFKTNLVPGKPGSGKLFEEEYVVNDGPVECLGMTFENDEKRREYFLEKLREKLKDPEFRKIEGFPIGEDEDILALSDPPYYTACPNPFIEDFIKHYGKPYDPNVPYSKEPFAADISGSKSTKVYMAHTYHTKVPPESIIPLIEHYTEPGDIILDPFCGSGMAGVAIHYVNAADDKPLPRRAILSDLSPFASFLTDRMTHSSGTGSQAALHYLEELKEEFGWLYKRNDGKEIAYAIWSDIWVCPNCGKEDNDWNLTIDENALTIKKPVCSQCGVELSRSRLPRKKTTILDPITGDVRKITAQKLVRIAIKKGRETLLLPPEKHDVEILDRASRLLSQFYIPAVKMPIGANTQQPISSHGYKYAHDFYTHRNLLFISRYMEGAKGKKEFKDLLFLLTSVLVKTASKLHAIGFKGNINLAGQAPNTLQIPSSLAERNLFILLRGKVKDIAAVYSYPKKQGVICVSTNSAGALDYVPDNSIDYIFTDPPFGANINYSEVSFLYEYWLKAFTNNRKEAIVNKYQNKSVADYEKLMEEALKETSEKLFV